MFCNVIATTTLFKIRMDCSYSKAGTQFTFGEIIMVSLYEY